MNVSRVSKEQSGDGRTPALFAPWPHARPRRSRASARPHQRGTPMSSMNDAAEPTVVEFVPGTTIEREKDSRSVLPIVGNGPPGTFVRFADGKRVPLPTDQIVAVDERDGFASVTFGAMRFTGLEGGRLNFVRERDLWPAEALSPERRGRMTLERAMVTCVRVGARRVWPLLH